ncbi:MAG: hypothetical protein JSR21_19335, partial [Proteobacteria bacterium]|nr:hypothetical protein [Pseudomonadota bacterium]
MSGTTYSVTTEAQLNADIAAINAASLTAAAGTTYTINVTTSLELTSNLTAIDMAAGTNLVISASAPTLVNGQNRYRGFVDLSGSVTLNNLTLSNMHATGGTGGNGLKPGGGGAGLGGAVFVASGASMTLNGVNFSGDVAHGGAGGKKTTSGIGAGGSGEPNGFGAGGAGGVAGGFGGGGGGGASGGFGAGSNGGAGAAMGGDVFVQHGGELTYGAGTAKAGQVVPGGVGAHGYGSGIFIQGNTSITLGSVTVSGVIADQTGSGGTGASAGAGSVIVNGAATLSATNTYTGGTTIVGSLTLAAKGAAGSGAITFGAGSALIAKAGDGPSNTLIGFAPGDSIDLQGVGLETGYSVGANNAVTFTGGTAVTLNFDPAQDLSGLAFAFGADAGTTGTMVSAVQTKFVVSSEADLNAVLIEIDNGGLYSALGVAYTITLLNGFSLSTDPNAVNLASGDTLTIDGGGNAINGGGQYRGLFVYAGAVT